MNGRTKSVAVAGFAANVQRSTVDVRQLASAAEPVVLTTGCAFETWPFGITWNATSILPCTGDA